MNSQQKKCPYCAEIINKEAIKCRYCASRLDRSNDLRDWTRNYEYRKVFGVCAGLARHLDVPVSIIRLAFIVFAFVSGGGILLYLALWIIMPWDHPPTQS